MSLSKLTPFLLARVSVLTGKASLRANQALLENNAWVGAEIAVALAEQEGALQPFQRMSKGLRETTVKTFLR